MKDLYYLINLLANKGQTVIEYIKNKICNLVIENETQINRWEEHFKDIIGNKGEINVESYAENDECATLRISTKPLKEIAQTINQLKSGKEELTI